MLLHRKISQTKSEKGAALVEFAIVSVLLFTLILGIIDFGIMIKNYHALSQVAREGARSAALGSSDDTVEARITTWATNLGLKTSNLTITPPTIEDTPVGKEVTVQLDYRYDMVTGNFFSPILGGKNYVMLSSTMVWHKE